MKPTTEQSARLEAIRAELRAEEISYAELAELQSLSHLIADDDTELLEAAGIPERIELGRMPDHYEGYRLIDDFWDCDCGIGVPKAVQKCKECGATRDENPDSRFNEILRQCPAILKLPWYCTTGIELDKGAVIESLARYEAPCFDSNNRREWQKFLADHDSEVKVYR